MDDLDHNTTTPSEASIKGITAKWIGPPVITFYLTSPTSPPPCLCLPTRDAQSNRVTLKMDVSHTEHSHVIGKGGNNIKKVMEETGCHIHFPDSNRNNQAEKSNQVSLRRAVVLSGCDLMHYSRRNVRFGFLVTRSIAVLFLRI